MQGAGFALLKGHLLGVCTFAQIARGNKSRAKKKSSSAACENEGSQDVV